MVFPVGPFSPHEALTYLTARLSADPDQRLGAVDLVQELSCDPLALAQASATIASSGVNCRDYREIFATRREQIAEASSEQPAAKAVTWTLAMECADELAPGGGAQLCLALAVLLGCQGIPEAVFSADAAAEFIAGPGRDRRWPARRRLLSLQRTGLLTIDPGSALAPGRLVRVHPAVQAGVRSAMPDSMRDRAALAAAAALLQTWPDRGRAVPAGMLAARLRDQPGPGRGRRAVGGRRAPGAAAGRPEPRQRPADPARPSGTGGRSPRPASGSSARPTRTRCSRSRGWRAPRWPPETAPRRSRSTSGSLTPRPGCLGPDHPRVAAAQAEFGNALLAMGQPAEAITVLEAALAAGERDRGAVDVLAIKDSLAAAYQAAGRYQDATRTARPRWSSASGARDPTTGRRWPPGGTWHAPTWPRASPRTPSRTAAAPSKAPNGPSDLTHPDTMDAVSVLASAYHSARRLRDAIPLYEQALSDRERVQGPDDPDTIGARGNLASAYHSAGRMASAVELYERTRADCQRVLGPDHPTRWRRGRTWRTATTAWAGSAEASEDAWRARWPTASGRCRPRTR